MWRAKDVYKLIQFFSVLLVFAGCTSTAGEFYLVGVDYREKGNDDAAVDYMIHSLNKEPTVGDQIFFKKTYREEVKKKLPQIAKDSCKRHLERAKSYEKQRNYEKAVSAYDKALLNAVIIKKKSGYSPGCKPAKILIDRNRVARLAAESFYERGKKLISKEEHKESAICFRRSFGFVRGYKDAQNLYLKQKEKAMKTIAFMPFSCKDRRFPTMVDNLTQQVVAKSMERNPEFVQIVNRTYVEKLLKEQDLSATDMVDPKEAVRQGKILGVYAFIFGKVLDITVKDSGWTKRNYTRKKKVDIYEDREYTDSKGRKKTKRVKVGEKTYRARVTIYKRTRSSRVSVSYKIIEVETGKVLNSSHLAKTFKDSWKFGRFRGDKEALTYSDERLCNREQKEPKTNKELVNLCVNYLSGELAKKCVRYFY